MSRYRMNPGELRHKIIFQKLNTDNQNDYGEPIKAWTDIYPTRAGIYPISGREFYAAETVNSEVTHKIKIRYAPNLTPDMRIEFGTRHFEIISIINFQEMNVEMQIMAKELL